MVSFTFFQTLCLHHHEGRSHHWWPTAPLTSLQKPADVCKMIGLCSSDEGQQEKLLQYLVQEAVQSAATAETVSLTGRTSNGSFIWLNVSDLMSSTVNRISPPPTAPSASSWSRLWISSSPKTGLRSAAAMSRFPTFTDARFPVLSLHLSSSLSAGGRDPPAGGDLQDFAPLPQEPVRVSDQQVQQDDTGRHPELRLAAGRLLPLTSVQRAGGSSWRSVGSNLMQKWKSSCHN